MKSLLVTLIFGLSSFAMADSAVEKVLGHCTNEFLEYSLYEAKKDLLKHLPRGYEFEDIQVTEPTVYGGNSINVYLHLRGLREQGNVYNFKPVFNSSRKCTRVRIDVMDFHY